MLPFHEAPASATSHAPHQRTLLVYGATLLATITATLIRLAMTPLIGPSAVPFITYFPAVLFVAWYGGFRPAALTVLLSVLAADYYFVPPTRTFLIPEHGDQLTAVIFLLVGLGIAFLGHSQRRALKLAERETRERAAAEQAERDHRERLQITLSSIGDAVLSTDAAGRVVFANRIALSVMRVREHELLGRPLTDVFRIVNEYTRATVENPVMRVLAEGVIVGLANHTVLIAPDGTEIPIDDSAAPIRDTDGTLRGTVLVFRDITARREAERTSRLLAAVVESSEDAIISKDVHGIVTSWNAGAQRIYGYTAEEIVGRPIGVLAPPDRPDELPGILERIKAGEHIAHYETVRRRKDGSLVPISLTVSPIHDGHGRVVGASKIARDITARKEAEERLRRSEQEATRMRDWLRTTVTSIGDAVVVTDMAGRIVLMNRVAETLTGWSEQDAGGMDLEQVFVIHNETTGAVVESPVRHALREGRIVGLANHTVLTAKDGRRVPIDDSAAPIRHTDGTLSGVVLVFRDVTERKQAEEAIERSLARFRIMADHAPILMWMAGIDKGCTWFNKPWLDFVGRRMEDEIGNGWAQNVHPADLDACFATYVASFDVREPFSMEYRLKRHDGEYRWVLDNGAPLRDGTGTFTGYIGSCTDITERKRAEDELVRANEDLRQFAFAASHDLQEPLRMITSYSQLLISAYYAKNDDEASRSVRVITEGTERMRELLGDLLAYTQLDAEQEPLLAIDLNLAMEKAAANLKTTVEQTGAEVSSTELPVVHGHETRFVQLFQNLLDNAIKYRGTARPRVQISSERVGNAWRIAVADNGMGIDPEYHQRVFGVFKRLHGKSIPGTGIGLAICQRVIEQYGGRIWVESRLNEGATFYFTLPAAKGMHA